ncbi:MAG TPA: CoA ester lyase [Candidatus Dormibacteraeota bacterium]
MSRSRRSVLVLPGSNRHMAEKAATVAAAEVVLDLEDAVPDDAEAKERGRHELLETLRELDFGDRTVAVRINGVRTPYAVHDIMALVPEVADRISCLVIPKVGGAGEVAFVEHMLAALESTSHHLGLELQIEGPKGLEAVGDIAGASSRTEALIFGPGDFAAAMGMPQLGIGQEASGYPGDIWHFALSRIAVAAKAHGLQAIDGPCSEIADGALLERSAERAAQLGYDGKWAIHPSQLEVVNKAFTPTADQVRQAEQILAALAGRGGASRLGGEMVDEAHGRMAREVLLRASGPTS